VFDPDHGTPIEVFVSSPIVPDTDPDTEQKIHVVQEVQVSVLIAITMFGFVELEPDII